MIKTITPEDLMTPRYTDIWYDNQSMLWVLQLKDRYNNQIGDAMFFCGVQEAIKNKIELEEKYNLTHKNVGDKG